MKKILVSVLLILVLLFSCTAQAEDDLHIVATIFPEYDWVLQVLGEDSAADVTLLLDNGVDLHSFQPTADDIIAISDCDMFIYVGGESDAWVDEVLAAARNTDMKVIDLLEVLGDSAMEEELKEGMEAEEEEEEGEDEEEEIEYDEHVWLSLRNAQTLVSAVCDTLCEIDSGSAEAYRANTDAYLEKLTALDTAYAEAVDAAEMKTLLFCDRFPFRYLTEDYGLDYYAAFAGCSAESEASFETMAFLTEKRKELELKHVIILEGSDGKLAQTVSGGQCDILTLDSMQGTTLKDVENGCTYLSVMEKNLETLKQALN